MNDVLHTLRHRPWRTAIVVSLGGLTLVSMGACQPDAAPPRVGADRDVHGCSGSTGHVWSGVQQRCLRLFEEALAFEPHADNPDPTLKAFVVLGPVVDGPRKAEVFLPHNRQALPLEVIKPLADDIRPVVLLNRDAHLDVVRVKDMYVLRIKEQVLFTHDAVTGSPLGKI